jgi:preprotein translocase subunit Sec63
MKHIGYEDFLNATQTLGLIGLETKEAVKKRYLKLSKKYHPDMPNGDTQKFQEINKAYKILESYMENFSFKFTKEEFCDQHPFGIKQDRWSLW